MELPNVDDAADRHLEEVAADIFELLGPGIELLELALIPDPASEIRLRARYRLGDATGESIGSGDTVIGAHARLREAVIFDRVGLGLRALVG